MLPNLKFEVTYDSGIQGNCAGIEAMIHKNCPWPKDQSLNEFDVLNPSIIPRDFCVFVIINFNSIFFY